MTHVNFDMLACALEKFKDLTTIENLSVAPKLKKLYGYLADRCSFVALENFNPEYLSIFSRDVLKKNCLRRPGVEGNGPGGRLRNGDQTPFLRLLWLNVA